MDFPSNDSYFSLLNLSFVENCHISIFTTFAKQSMINRLSNSINRNRSAAKISKVMSSNTYPIAANSPFCNKFSFLLHSLPIALLEWKSRSCFKGLLQIAAGNLKHLQMSLKQPNEAAHGCKWPQIKFPSQGIVHKWQKLEARANHEYIH